jgi:16S rRNA (cytosine1402-N4)-methyltransferase
MKDAFHIPVLLDESMKFLLVKDEGVYVDGTLGGGGHAEEVLKRTRARLIAFDIDPEAIRYGSERLRRYGDRVLILNENFANIRSSLDKIGIKSISGLILDLGVSSHQLSRGRGFSFRFDEKLDMRMDRESPLSAYDIVNSYSKERLVEIILKYGEERRAKAIASEIVRWRERRKIETTFDLARIVEKVAVKKYRLKTLARVFQAIRIEVNNELENLRNVLRDSVDLLEEGARVVVISYHSLEDRIVKEFFRSEGRLEVLTKKPVVPGEDEISKNPRARSAKLRSAEKINPRAGEKKKEDQNTHN